LEKHRENLVNIMDISLEYLKKAWKNLRKLKGRDWEKNMENLERTWEKYWKNFGKILRKYWGNLEKIEKTK
jgi:hypothetical protein